MDFKAANAAATVAVAARDAAHLVCQTATHKANLERGVSNSSALALKAAIAALDAATAPDASLFIRVEDLSIEALHDAQMAKSATLRRKAAAEAALGASEAADAAVTAALLAAPKRR